MTTCEFIFHSLCFTELSSCCFPSLKPLGSGLDHIIFRRIQPPQKLDFFLNYYQFHFIFQSNVVEEVATEFLCDHLCNRSRMSRGQRSLFWSSRDFLNNPPCCDIHIKYLSDTVHSEIECFITRKSGVQVHTLYASCQLSCCCLPMLLVNL